MPLPGTDDFLSLKNVRLKWTLPGGSQTVVAEATEVQISQKLSFAPRKPGGSWVATKVPDELDLDIKVKGWNSLEISLMDLKPGARLASFDVASTETGTPTVLPAWVTTRFPVSGWMLGNTDTTLGDKPSEWTTDIATSVRGSVPV